MTEINIRIVLPNLRQVTFLMAGIALGLGAAAVISDLRSPKSWIKEQISRIGESPVYSKKQLSLFEEKFKNPDDPVKLYHNLSFSYTADCLSCSENALEISKIINTTPGWIVSSLSSQVDDGSRFGLVIETDRGSPASQEALIVFTSALQSANIPFVVKEPTHQMKADLVVWFGL